MHLDLPPEDFRALAAPIIEKSAGAIAVEMSKVAKAMAADAAEGWMTKEETMKFVRLESERSLERWMKPVSDGGLGMPHFKIGGMVRFSRTRIEAWAIATAEVNQMPVVQFREVA